MKRKTLGDPMPIDHDIAILKDRFFKKPVQKSILAAQAFDFKGDKYVTKKVRDVSLTRDMLTGLYLCLYQIVSKYFKPIEVMKCTRIRLRNSFRGDNLKKKRTKILSFLHMTLLLDLIYVPTKYYQIISNSTGVMVCTRFWFQGR